MGLMLAAARALGDVLLAPFIWLPPAAGLLCLSIAGGLLLLLAFRALTPQRRLRRVKERMSATIYELRLFAASPRRVLGAQARALGLTILYVGLAAPSLVLLVPTFGLLAARAALIYELRPLTPGESVLLSVRLSQPLPRDAVEITAAGDGLVVLGPTLVLDEPPELHVRLRARHPGSHSVSIRAGEQTVDKTVRVTAPGARAAVSLARSQASAFWSLLGNEPALEPAGQVEAVFLDYPAEPLMLLGLPWYVHLVVLSMAAALAFRRRLGVVL